MKRLLTVVLVLAIAFVITGFFRNWFGFETTQAGENGKKGITLSWNKDKFKGDWGKATGKLKGLAKSAVEKVKGVAKKVTDKESELEGKVTGVNVDEKTVTVEAGGKSIPLPFLGSDMKDLKQLEGKDVKVTLATSEEGVSISNIEAKK